MAYFGDGDSPISKPQLRIKSAKGASADSPVCYCFYYFGVAMADALGGPSIWDFVVAQTKLGLCACETANPSGCCCLKDFQRHCRGRHGVKLLPGLFVSSGDGVSGRGLFSESPAFLHYISTV